MCLKEIFLKHVDIEQEQIVVFCSLLQAINVKQKMLHIKRYTKNFQTPDKRITGYSFSFFLLGYWLLSILKPKI